MSEVKQNETRKPKYQEIIDEIVRILEENDVDPEVVEKIENLK